MTLLPTPFHPRTAEYNTGNAWRARAGFTVPAVFSSVAEEALAARFAAVLLDSTPMERLRVHGNGASALLTAACGFDAAALTPYLWHEALWRTGAGGVRGFGAVVRTGENNFVVMGRALDRAWFQDAAPRFNAVARDATGERGLLSLLGPAASAVLEAAELGEAAQLAPHGHAVIDWRGIAVGVSRANALARLLGGVEIACAPEDAVIVFDRLMAAGRAFGVIPAGEDASDLLHLELGVALADADFVPARAATDTTPLPSEVGLGTAEGETLVLAGLELDSETPASHTPVFANGGAAGRTLGSAYSPALRRAIALALLPARLTTPGTPVIVRAARDGRLADISARVAKLPFL